MNAGALTNEQLQMIVENARGFLDSGRARDPETVRSVLQQAESEIHRRESEGRP